MKKSVLWLLVIYISIFSSPKDLPNFPFVFVDAEAEQQCKPDFAKITIEVFSSSEKASPAFDTVETISKILFDIFKQFNIPEEDLVAYSIQKDNDTWYRSKEDTPKYRISRDIEIKLKQLEKYSIFIDTLASLSNIKITRTAFDIVNEKEIDSKLFKDACNMARENAKLLVEGMNADLGDIHALSEFKFGDIRRYYGMGLDPDYVARGSQTKGGSSEQTTFMVPKSILKSKIIYAIFKLKKK